MYRYLENDDLGPKRTQFLRTLNVIEVCQYLSELIHRIGRHALHAAFLLIAQRDTGYFDAAGEAASCYKLSAFDVHGNEGPCAVALPGLPLAVPPLSLALHGVWPNPARGTDLTVEFSLPDAQAARLELLDVSGRLVAVRDVGGLGPGVHRVNVAAGRRLAPGVHLVRLTCGRQTLTTKAVLFR